MKLTKQESTIVIGMHRIVADMDRKTKQICKQHGLTLGQFAVLEALNQKGDLNVGEVKELVLSTDGTIPVVTGNLEKMGYIDRKQDEADRRKYILSLTEDGQKLINEVYPENNQMLSRLLDILSTEEKDMLTEVIHKYRDANRPESGRDVDEGRRL